MPVTQNFPFSEAENYTLSNAEISADTGILGTVNNTGQTFTQSFASSSGFTHDSAKAEFAGGLVRAIDRRPSNATLWASFASSVDANWGGGTLTGTNNGGTLNAGKLELHGASSNKYLDYSGVSNADSLQVGCIRAKITPNYSGAPASKFQVFFWAAQAAESDNNGLGVYHNLDGDLVVNINNSTGTGIIQNISFGAWSPVAGTTYEIELNWDITTGATRLFVDGVQKGSTNNSTGTRSGAVGLLRIGMTAVQSTGNQANFAIASILVFSTVQHTAGYTPGSDPEETIYAASAVVLPDFLYTGLETVMALSAMTTTETGSPRYTVEGKYWNGSSWVVSNGTYAQANPASTVNTNLPTLSVSGQTAISVSVYFTDTNTLPSVDLLTLTYTGRKYSPTGYIEPLQPVPVQALVSYEESVTKPSDTELKVILKIDGVLTWFDGAEWTTSDGTIDEANTESELNDNFDSLELGQNSELYVRWVLTTSQVAATPSIDDATLEYDFGAVDQPLTTCTVYGYLKDIGDNPVAAADVTVSLRRRTKEYKEASGNVIFGDTLETTSDANGYFEFELVRSSEYEGSGVYEITITKSDEETSLIGSRSLRFEVPDSAQKDITDLLTSV